MNTMLIISPIWNLSYTNIYSHVCSVFAVPMTPSTANPPTIQKKTNKQKKR